MTLLPNILFNKTLAQLRQIGARGGRAAARNRRARLRAAGLASPSPSPTPAHLETAAEAIAALDAQFPWLRGAEKRLRSQPTSASSLLPSHRSAHGA